MNLSAFTIPHDKANHAVYGYLAAWLAALVARFSGIPEAPAAQAASFTVGLLREIYGWKWGTGFSPADLAVTTVAGTPVAILFL